MSNLDLQKDSISKLFLHYLIPAVIGMVIMSLHIVIDGIFVGRGIGSNGLAAVNICLPIFSILIGLGIFMGTGGATVVSIKYGENKDKEANNIFTQSMIILLIITFLMSIFGEIYLEKICYGLGANHEILCYVKDYTGMFLYFSCFVAVAGALNCFVRNDTAPKLAMYAMIIGALTNGILDYLFIFVFSWGLKGAAFATGIAQVVEVVILLFHFLRKEGRLRWCKPKFVLEDVMRIFKTGFPNFITEISLGIITFVFNIVLMKSIGEIGVATYSIISYIASLMLMIFMGISQAMQPIISFNYGSKAHERVNEVYKLAIWGSSIIGIVFLILGTILGKNMIMLFNNSDTQLIEMTCHAIKIYFIAYLFMGGNIVIATYFQAIEATKLATVITSLRGCVFIIVGIYMLPKIWGINGIWLTVPIAEALTLLIAHFLLRGYRKEFQKINECLERLD